jgi:predicted DNA-binding transcriptional regulator YafY
MTILSRFKGIPQIEALSDIFIRLQKGSSPTNVGDIVGFDENPFLTGLDHLGELLNSILYQKVLKIDYQNFKSQDSYFLELHPYYLKQYNKRWFVFGFNPTMDKMDWNLALDRIKTIEQISTPYKPNDQIVWEEYFEDIVGVTRPQDGKVQKIELWVDPETVPYIVTKPIHGSQKKLESETEGLTIQLNLIPNFEFYQLILSYGDRVKILAPKETQDHISKLLKRALDLYFL